MSNHATQQARAQLDSILEMVATLREAEFNEDDSALEEARDAIYDDPLEISVRSGWVAPVGMSGPLDPEEFCILLCTGGPAVRVIGALDSNCLPTNVRLESQDWFEPWTAYPLTITQQETLQVYCEQFYFGE